MRLIVLAAGQGFKLDGFNKLLVTDPASGETVLERYLRLFPGYEVSVVVGFQAIRVMMAHPELDYIYNDRWSLTGNSYSLALALDDRPALVMSSDLFFDEPLAERIRQAPANTVFATRAENKQPNSVRCQVVDGVVRKLYLGEPERADDLETLGAYKVSEPGLLREWKRRCMAERNSFAGVNLPVEGGAFQAVERGNCFFHEVNNHHDYIALIQHRRGQAGT